MNERPDKTIMDYVEIALRRKWWLTIPFVLITAIGVFVSFQLPEVYQSNALILVEPQKVPESYVQSTITGSVGELLTTLRQQILSRTLLQRIIDEFGLREDRSDSFPQTLLQKVKKVLGINGKSSSQRSNEEIIEEMREKITIKTIGTRQDINAFTLSFEHRNPQTAMLVTNRLTTLFIEANLQNREDLVEGASEFLEQELERLRGTLEAQEARLSRFKRRYMGELPSQLDANLRTLDRLQLELDSIKKDIKEQEERKASLERQLASGEVLSGQPNSPEVRLAELKHRLATLEAEYQESYPDIILTRQQIQDVEDELAREPSASRDLPEPAPIPREERALFQSMKEELIILKAQEETLNQKIKEYERRVEQAPIREQQLMALIRDYENTQNNYQSLLGKKLNAKISENLEKRQKGELFRIIDPAELPSKPFKPNRLKISLIGLMLGLATGVGFVLLIEQRDTSFHRQEDLEQATGIVVLAAIPRYNQGKMSTTSGRGHSVKAHSAAGGKDHEQNG